MEPKSFLEKTVGGTSPGPTEAMSLARMSLQNTDGLDRVGGNGSNEILNLFSMDIGCGL